MKLNLILFVCMSISLELLFLDARLMMGMELSIREQKQEADEEDSSNSSEEADTDEEESEESGIKKQVEAKRYTEPVVVGLVITSDDEDITSILDVYIQGSIAQFILYAGNSSSYARTLQLQEYLENKGIKEVVIVNEINSALVDAYNELLLSAYEQFKNTRFLLIAHSSWRPCKLEQLVEFCQKHMHDEKAQNYELDLLLEDSVAFQAACLLDITTEAYFTDEVEECICQILDAQATPKADAPDIETSFVQTSQQRLNLPRLRYSLMYQQKYTGLFLFYS